MIGIVLPLQMMSNVVNYTEELLAASKICCAVKFNGIAEVPTLNS